MLVKSAWLELLRCTDNLSEWRMYDNYYVCPKNHRIYCFSIKLYCIEYWKTQPGQTTCHIFEQFITHGDKVHRIAKKCFRHKELKCFYKWEIIQILFQGFPMKPNLLSFLLLLILMDNWEEFWACLIQTFYLITTTAWNIKSLRADISWIVSLITIGSICQEY